MNEPLRPMNLGEILDRSFQIYRSRFLVFVGIAIMPLLGLLAFNLVAKILGKMAPDPNLPASFMSAMRDLYSWLPSDWPELFVRCLTWPAFVYLTARFYLKRRATLRSTIRFCDVRRQSWLVLAGVLCVVWHLLPHALNRLVWSSGIAGSATMSLQTISAFVSLARFILEFLLILTFSFCVPAWTLESLSMRPALLRGWRLIKGIWGRVFVAWFMTNVIGLMLSATLAGVTLFVFQLVFSHAQGTNLYYMIRSGIITCTIKIASILIAPLLPIVITLFYYDQRIRHEGYDIERMMEAAGMNAPQTPLGGEVLAGSIEPEKSLS